MKQTANNHAISLEILQCNFWQHNTKKPLWSWISCLSVSREIYELFFISLAVQKLLQTVNPKAVERNLRKFKILNFCGSALYEMNDGKILLDFRHLLTLCFDWQYVDEIVIINCWWQIHVHVVRAESDLFFIYWICMKFITFMSIRGIFPLFFSCLFYFGK